VPRFYITLILLLTAYCAFAQKDLSGFIIKNNFDTVSGTFSTRKLAAHECAFTETGQSAETTYTPKDIKGFGIKDGRYFAGYTVKEFGPTVFAEVLSNGKMTLLRYEQKFYIVDGATAIELEIIRSMETVDGHAAYRTNNKYQQTLTWKFQDCPAAVEKVKNTTLEERSLRKVFDQYNSCFDKTVKQRTRQKPDLILGVEAGYVSTALGSLVPEFSEFLDPKFKGPKSSILPGIFFQFQPANRHLMFAVGISKASFLFESRTTYKQGVEIHDYNKVSYDAVKIPFSAGLNFGNRKLRPFVRAGAVVSLFSKKTVERDRQYMTNPPMNINTLAFEFQNAPVQLQFEAGAQYQVGKFFASLKGRYEFGSAPFTENISKTGISGITQTTISALLSVGYNFKRK